MIMALAIEFSHREEPLISFAGRDLSSQEEREKNVDGQAVKKRLKKNVHYSFFSLSLVGVRKKGGERLHMAQRP